MISTQLYKRVKGFATTSSTRGKEKTVVRSEKRAGGTLFESNGVDSRGRKEHTPAGQKTERAGGRKTLANSKRVDVWGGGNSSEWDRKKVQNQAGVRKEIGGGKKKSHVV